MTAAIKQKRPEQAPTDSLDRLGWLYENKASVCIGGNEIRDHLRASRGRNTDRHKDCALTLAEVADLAEVRFGTAATAESDPTGVSIGVLERIARAHNQKVAIIFYEDE